MAATYIFVSLFIRVLELNPVAVRKKSKNHISLKPLIVEGQKNNYQYHDEGVQSFHALTTAQHSVCDQWNNYPLL